MKEKIGAIAAIRSLIRILKGKPQIPASLSDNALLKVILKRRSIRSFTGQVIPEDHFSAILEAGRLAPSTVNLQTWTFAVFDSALWQEVFDRAIPFHAQRAIIIIADTYRIRQVLDVFPYSPLVEYTIAVMNASLAAMNMNIAAEALGISSVMLSETGRSGVLDAQYLKEKLNLPQGAIPLMTIVFGYAHGTYPAMPPKLPSDHIIINKQYQFPNPEVMQSWLSQMVAGYAASHIGSTFSSQVQIYQRKIGQAESDLHKMIFYNDDK